MKAQSLSAAEQRKVAELLSAPHAPQGDRENDFKTALYLVAALYQSEFNGIASLGVITKLLGAVGFKGNLGQIGADAYTATLGELVNDGALVRLEPFKIYASPEGLLTFNATVRSREEKVLSFANETEKTYVFYVTDAEGREYKLKNRIAILPNDEVEVKAVRGSEYAFASKLTKKRLCVLGRVMFMGGKNGRTATLMPDEPNLQGFKFDFVDLEALGECKSGDVVIAEITERQSRRFCVKARETVRDLGNLNNIIVMAVLRNDIPNVWPQGVTSSLSKVPETVSENDWQGREDLRELPLVTIDGEDARDFDDAVYCRKEDDGWRLFVSIADVSYYVRPGSALDHEAALRCNSCYFPNYVIPMLPEKLSNGICSLNPDVDRLCMTCEMRIDKNGGIKDYRFYPAVMRSHARLTYTEAWQMIEKGEPIYPEHQGSVQDVKALYELYKALLAARERRGGISIESPEISFAFNEDMEITDIRPTQRNDAHKLIEECMIAANVAAATFVSERRGQTLYRVHAKPSEKKLSLLSAQLTRFGLMLPNIEEPEPKDYAMLEKKMEGREDASIVGELLLRSMSKAEYSPDNIGHFGLALQKYAHFTSPIRRYADLQLHRVIKYLLEKEQPRNWGKIGAASYTREELMGIGAKCNGRELAADTAEREVDNELACVFLQKFIGEALDGTITGVTRFGLFVRLNRFMVDGMVYIGNLGNDYLEFDEATQTLISSYGKRRYQVGQPLKVVVASIDQQTHKIDLLPAGGVSQNQLRKQAKTLQEKSARVRAKYPAEDKDALLSRLSDISVSREATDADTVKKERPRDNMAADVITSAHFANPLMMPQRSSEITDRKRRSKDRDGKDSKSSGGKGRRKSKK